MTSSSPLAPAGRRANIKTEPPEVAEGRVLVIDGEVEAGRLAAFYLEKFFVVDWAPTARAGRAILRAGEPDAVILEYRLPDCSGLELIRDIRGEHEELPIVMATSHGSEQVCAAAFRLGIRDYLSKPFGESELVASVRRLTRRDALRSVPAAATSATSWSMPAPEEPADARLKLVARRVRERYSEPLSVGELARSVNTSRWELSRRFTAHFRVSLRTYIAQVRVARAMELLGDVRMSVTDIAHEVGFYDLPRFDKVFRRVNGMSPSAYRRLAQKGKSANT